MVDPVWISELHDGLAAMDEHFVTAMGKGSYKDQQDAARGALALVLIAFKKKPELEGVTRSLQALFFAMEGLGRGSEQPLLQNHAGRHGGSLITGAQEVIQSRTIAMCDILVEAGHTAKQAVEICTRILRTAGVRGFRKKNPITEGTVRDWRNQCSAGDLPEIREHANAAILAMRDVFMSNTGRWPPSKPEAEQLVSANAGYLESLAQSVPSKK